MDSFDAIKIKRGNRTKLPRIRFEGRLKTTIPGNIIYENDKLIVLGEFLITNAVQSSNLLRMFPMAYHMFITQSLKDLTFILWKEEVEIIKV